MAKAEVGDERAGEDPTVNALIELRHAARQGIGVFAVRNDVQRNRVGRALQARRRGHLRGDVAHHRFRYGGPAALAGVMLNPVAGVQGIYSAAQLREKIPARSPLCAAAAARGRGTNGTNLGGGAIWPLSIFRAESE